METPIKQRRLASRRRSVVKALSYRLVIVCLDFVTVYVFTGAVRVAVGFMVVSNLYTTILYLVHERIWAQVQWGLASAP